MFSGKYFILLQELLNHIFIIDLKKETIKYDRGMSIKYVQSIKLEIRSN